MVVSPLGRWAALNILEWIFIYLFGAYLYYSAAPQKNVVLGSLHLPQNLKNSRKKLRA